MRTSLKSARGRLSSAMLGIFGVAAAMASTPAGATIDPAHQFITNGGFETLTNGLGQLSRNTVATGWTSANDGSGNYGFNYVFNASTASTTGSPGDVGYEKLWGPGNGSSNNLDAAHTTGNFLGSDGAYHLGKVTQAIAGLIIGQSYQLTFNFAGAQEYGTTGVQTESWYYGFEDQNFDQQTAVLNNVTKGFTGWQAQTYNFVATKTSDTLYFLAQGTPSGQPPMSLLDNVSLIGAYGTVSAAPDPAIWMLMLVGFGLVGFSLRRHSSAPLPHRVSA